MNINIPYEVGDKVFYFNGANNITTGIIREMHVNLVWNTTWFRILKKNKRIVEFTFGVQYGSTPFGACYDHPHKVGHTKEELLAQY